MSSPSSVSCSIISKAFDDTIILVEEVLLEPVRIARSIENNCNMLINSLYPIIIFQVNSIENNILSVLHLNFVNDLEDGGFCNALFACQAFKNIIIEQHSLYLPWLDQSVIDQLNTNFDVFQRDICLIGMKNLANAATDTLLSQYITKLQDLLQSFTDALRLNELITRYQNILTASGIFGYLDTLEEFTRCLTSVCDYSSSSSNKLEDIRKKLHLNTDNSIDQESFLDKFNEKNSSLTLKINDLITKCETRSVTTSINKDQLMIF